MDLFDLIRMVLRQWRIVVPLTVVTVAAAVLMQSVDPPPYEAQGYVALETPAFDVGNQAAPPLDALQLLDDIRREDGDRSFAASVLGGDNYAITSSAEEPGDAVDVVDSVVADLRDDMQTLQDEGGVPDDERVNLRLLTPQIEAEAQTDGSFLASATVYVDDPAVAAVNPYGLDSTTRRLLQVGIMGDVGQARFEEATGGDVELEVIQDDRDAAPLLLVITTGPDADEAIDAFDVARDLMAEDLAERQDRADVLTSQRLSLTAIDPPREAEISGPPVTRTTAAVVVLGALLTLGAAFGAEFLSRRRARSRQLAAGGTADRSPEADAVGVDGLGDDGLGDDGVGNDVAAATSVRDDGGSRAPAPPAGSNQDRELRVIAKSDAATRSGDAASSPIGGESHGPVPPTPAPPMRPTSGSLESRLRGATSTAREDGPVEPEPDDTGPTGTDHEDGDGSGSDRGPLSPPASARDWRARLDETSSGRPSR